MNLEEIARKLLGAENAVKSGLSRPRDWTEMPQQVTPPAPAPAPLDVDPMPGPSGPAGPAGSEGPPGPEGKVGPEGPAGKEGKVGPEGPAGKEGPPGPEGHEGKVGPAGPEGKVGPEGPAGKEGKVGPEGPAGKEGPPGPEGHEGKVGPAGPEGKVGPEGPAGKEGKVGPEGPAGKEGPPGPEGHEGKVGPAGPEGHEGKVGPAGPEGPAGKEGKVGPEGPAGKEGPKGATGATGAPGLEWKGAWAGGTNYLVNQAVTHGGSSWRAIKEGAAHEPPNAEYWELLAEKGAEGAKGSTGAEGPEGKPGVIACRLASVVNLAGARVANVITATAAGALTVSGTAAAIGDLVLLTAQTSGVDNGPYVVTKAGAEAEKWVLTRAPKMETSAQCVAGMLFTVSEGEAATVKNSEWQLTTKAPITLNTTALTFARKDVPMWEEVIGIERAYGVLSAAIAAAAYRLGPEPLNNVAANGESGEGGASVVGVLPNFIHIKPSLFAIAGKAAKLGIRFTALTNATAPFVGTIEVGLFLMKQPAGEKKLKIEYEAASAITTATLINPPASTHSTSTAVFSAMPAEGTYSLLVKTTAALTANAIVAIAAELVVIQE